MDGNVVGPATLAMTQAVGSFQFFLPRLSDVRKADPVRDTGMIGDVRLGEVAATTLCLGVGAMVSSLTGSSVPIVVSMLTALMLVCLYEAALQGDRPMEPKLGERSTDA
jgi:hypothetical protein